MLSDSWVKGSLKILKSTEYKVFVGGVALMQYIQYMSAFVIILLTSVYVHIRSLDDSGVTVACNIINLCLYRACGFQRGKM